MRRIFVYLILLSVTSLAETKGLKAVPVKDSAGNQVGLYKGSYALVVGVSDYTAGWPRLSSVMDETRDVQVALEANGFSVTRVIDPDNERLENAFKVFIDKYGYDRDNRLLFYFSGHGFSRKKGEKGYLVPVNAPDPRADEKGFLRKALPMSQVIAWCRQMEAKHALFLFDSCFSGTIFKTKALPEIPPHISSITSRPVRQFITAGDAGEEVPAKSVFAKCLIRALNGEADYNKDGYITGTELGMYLNERVLHYDSGQTPQYGKIRDPELDEGDFVFEVSKLIEGVKSESADTETSEPMEETVKAVASETSVKFKPLYLTDTVYDKVVELINNNYYKTVSLDLSAKPDVNALLAQLNERCRYLTPEDYKDLTIEVKSSLVGVGMTLQMKDGKLAVVGVFEDTPAYKAGILSGDIILAIDGISTDGLGLKDSVNKIRGRADTKVTMKIQREGQEAPLYREMIREQVDIPIIKGTRMLGKSIGYVRITSFAQGTEEELKNKIKSIEKMGLKSLIIDLRDCPGGLLSTGVNVASLFVKKGETVVTIKEGKSGGITKLSSQTKPVFDKLRLVVLVNKATVSVAEVLASCLRDQRGAIIVGERTFGKNTVETVLSLDNGGALLISSAERCTSKEKSFTGGIIPDFTVEIESSEREKIRIRQMQVETSGQLTAAEIEEYSNVVDPQLAAAIKNLQVQ